MKTLGVVGLVLLVVVAAVADERLGGKRITHEEPKDQPSGSAPPPFLGVREAAQKLRSFGNRRDDTTPAPPAMPKDAASPTYVKDALIAAVDTAIDGFKGEEHASGAPGVTGRAGEEAKDAARRVKSYVKRAAAEMRTDPAVRELKRRDTPNFMEKMVNAKVPVAPAPLMERELTVEDVNRAIYRLVRCVALVAATAVSDTNTRQFRKDVLLNLVPAKVDADSLEEAAQVASTALTIDGSSLETLVRTFNSQDTLAAIVKKLSETYGTEQVELIDSPVTASLKRALGTNAARARPPQREEL
ncbi:hypothetical protein Pelo_10262 [Pelomyxa schiedti]|nr:hypothetical protein Pelo_10262 [Pelomyxa schiedti]